MLEDQCKRIYDEVRRDIKDGDLALYQRDWRLSNRLVARSGGTPYCHVGMVFWAHNHLLLLETLQGHGGHLVRMSRQVEQYKGKWDIFKVAHENYDAEKAVKFMIEIIGEPYGWSSLLKTAVSHLPILRKIWPVTAKDYLTVGFPYCSMAVSQAVMVGGIDLCPTRSHLYTEPGHIALSEDTRYQFTLI